MACRQREIERRPLVDRAFGPDPAAVALDHALHDRKSHFRPGKLLRAVQPLEDAEQLLLPRAES